MLYVVACIWALFAPAPSSHACLPLHGTLPRCRTMHPARQSSAAAEPAAASNRQRVSMETPAPACRPRAHPLPPHGDVRPRTKPVHAHCPLLL